MQITVRCARFLKVSCKNPSTIARKSSSSLMAINRHLSKNSHTRSGRSICASPSASAE